MINKIRSYILYIFFPPFSELQLVSLFYILLLSVIHRWELILNLLFVSPITFAIGFLSIPISFLVLRSAISFQQITRFERNVFALGFYFLISLLTVLTLFSSSESGIFTSGSNWLDRFENLIIYFLMIKSLFGLLLLRSLSHKMIEDMGNQMKKDHISVIELILIVLIAPIIYLLLQANNSFAQVLCLSYFYLTTMINISSKVINKYSITR